MFLEKSIHLSMCFDAFLSCSIFKKFSGSSTRECEKKSFKLHGMTLDQSEFSLKVGALVCLFVMTFVLKRNQSACEDETMIRNILAMQFARSLNLPFQRFGFCHLWINQVCFRLCFSVLI